MFVRPTSLGLAFLNAALKTGAHPAAASVVSLIQANDRYKNKMVSGYNRTEIDGLKLSDDTARTLHASVLR